MDFFEVSWGGNIIGDGSNLLEALQAYETVKPEDGDWESACAQEGVDPHINHYSSFEDFLDNAERIEKINVNSMMILEAIQGLLNN